MGKKKVGLGGSRKKSRKEKRKEQRTLKKVKKNEHYFKRFKKEAPKHPFTIPKEPKDDPLVGLSEKTEPQAKQLEPDDEPVKKPRRQEKTLVEKIREAREKSGVLAEKRKGAEKRARNAQLREANKAEERQIKHLATLMKMNKRRKKGKTPSLPKTFVSDGLDYLLDVTDPEKLKDLKLQEPTFEDDEDDFEEDLAMVTDAARGQAVEVEEDQPDSASGGEGQAESEEGAEQSFSDDAGSDDGTGDGEGGLDSDAEGMDGFVRDSGSDSDEPDTVAADATIADPEDNSCEDDDDDDGEDEEIDEEGSGDEEAITEGSSDESEGEFADEVDEGASETDSVTAGKKSGSLKRPANERKRKLIEDVGEEDLALNETKKSKKKKRINENQDTDNDGVWEDIYGRLRGKDGSVLTGTGSSGAVPPDAGDGGPATAGRYLPPALRAQQMALSGDKRAELALLRRRLQGQLNRLSARSARGVLALLEELYAGHSRHDTSQALTQLVHEACVSPAAARPDRLLMEHVMLVAALHANVGTEVGAHFLLKTAQQFHKLLMSEDRDDESKELDNLVMLLAHLYTFRVTDSGVIYDVLKILADRFSAKDVDLILTVLRSVGFTMRKDDPAALKELILQLQARAAADAGTAAADGRIRFLLDIVMALRNNNINKIPQYDPGLGQELNKLLKTLVNPNQTITELNISLEDLLKAEERGKWWVVGSAWSGSLKERQQPAAGEEEAADGARPRLPAAGQQYSAELLELARRQRMNTDLRRHVFCALMTAEDYLDCFEKLMRLGLRGPQQEQEMATVVLGCALRERTFNPYYSHLLERLCAADRKYQMRVKIAVWEHLKQLASLGSGPASNLAKILAHLISTTQLSIAVLKVVEFSEMSKPMVRFLRQLLLALLLQSEDERAVRSLFQRAAGAPLKHMRDSLVLFLHHFVLRNKQKLADADTVATLEERARAAVAALKAADGVLRL
ncbi:nucleolar MIF4G domain-containing protein 1-like isoform X2 [Pollicipes pollicipes]|uniref:nucleolar MIF4G domain-containing protein 1-like isoform X2 n=1 Tax=Pollicipes pollicipes TaxID=41117 RepID=UPI001885A26F|nr:nucleolar MIF4G domain-containing protein 1-like isoform X2 [Pollicipes pollicipes]